MCCGQGLCPYHPRPIAKRRHMPPFRSDSIPRAPHASVLTALRHRGRAFTVHAAELRTQACSPHFVIEGALSPYTPPKARDFPRGSAPRPHLRPNAKWRPASPFWSDSIPCAPHASVLTALRHRGRTFTVHAAESARFSEGLCHLTSRRQTFISAAPAMKRRLHSSSPHASVLTALRHRGRAFTVHAAESARFSEGLCPLTPVGISSPHSGL